MLGRSGFTAFAQDRIHFLNQSMCDAVVQAVVSFDQCLDEKLFTESLDRLLESESILKCQWVDRAGFPRWELSPCELAERFQLVLSEDIQQDLDSFMSVPLDPKTESLIQVRIFRVQEADGLRDTACFKLSHVVSDVSGLRYFLQKLGDTYAKLRENPDYQPVKADARCGGWEVFFRLSRKQKIRVLQKGHKDFIKKGQWRIPFDSQETGGMTYHTRLLPADKFLGLTQYAEEHHVSLNLVMLTSFARALRRFSNAETEASLPLINTFDLRHYLRRGQCPGICNLSVPLVPSVSFRDGDTFEQTLSHLAVAMLEQKKSVPGVLQALLMELMFFVPFPLISRMIRQSMAQISSSEVSTPLFSDGGSANIEFPGEKIRHVYGVGPIAYAPLFMMTASVFQNTLTLAIGFCQESISCQSIDHFFDLMEEEMSLRQTVPAVDTSAAL